MAKKKSGGGGGGVVENTIEYYLTLNKFQLAVSEQLGSLSPSETIGKCLFPYML